MTNDEVLKSLAFLKNVELKDLQGLNTKYTKTLYEMYFTDFDVIEQFVKEQIKKNEPKKEWRIVFKKDRVNRRALGNPAKYFESHKRMITYWKEDFFPATLINLKTKRKAVIEKLPTKEELTQIVKGLKEETNKC